MQVFNVTSYVYDFMLQVILKTGPPVVITTSNCECKAGSGSCSHLLGLLYTICHFVKLGCKTVPPLISKTSLPQTWHVPQRSEGLSSKSTDLLCISKVKPDHLYSQPSRKRKRVIEGVLPTVYCPVKQPVPVQDFANQLFVNLKCVNSDAQILKLLPDPSKNSVIPTTSSKYGEVPYGSPISYQQPENVTLNADIQTPDAPPFPEFSFPEQPAYSTALPKHLFDMNAGLQVDRETALLLEKETVKQSESTLWKTLRSQRLTSSTFKDICVRANDFESLAVRLVNPRCVQTAAMKHGLEFEPVAARSYCEITGNSVYMCGFVINPHAPHLGTSPDRKVHDNFTDMHFGLLEIKCPKANSYVQCKYLREINGTYRLNRSHSYFYQIMGQMGITGMPWCDLFVHTETDYHLERIFYDEKLWADMKVKLDMFFYNYYLPILSRKD